MQGNIQNIMAAIEFIEDHLHEKLDLETIANALHYSKYYLHRMFRDTVSLTMQTYIQRRKLSEAAQLLVFSNKSVLEIALLVGYESQQSFTDSFKAMYKKTPNRFRQEGDFYPLQLRYVLNDKLTKLKDNKLKEKIVCATRQDIEAWIKLVHLVIDGFPCLKERQYFEWLQGCVKDRRAFILKETGTAIGIMAFHEITGSIDFLGVHPQCRKKGIATAFCAKALHELARNEAIAVTTFRDGDKADTGYRQAFKRIGFVEAELLTEFGYPTQRFILRK